MVCLGNMLLCLSMSGTDPTMHPIYPLTLSVEDVLTGEALPAALTSRLWRSSTTDELIITIGKQRHVISAGTDDGAVSGNALKRLDEKTHRYSDTMGTGWYFKGSFPIRISDDTHRISLRYSHRMLSALSIVDDTGATHQLVLTRSGESLTAIEDIDRSVRIDIDRNPETGTTSFHDAFRSVYIQRRSTPEGNASTNPSAQDPDCEAFSSTAEGPSLDVTVESSSDLDDTTPQGLPHQGLPQNTAAPETQSSERLSCEADEANYRPPHASFPDAQQLPIRPLDCASYFQMPSATDRGSAIESAMANAGAFPGSIQTVRSFPIIDFLSGGVAHVVHTRDLSSASYDAHRHPDALYRQLLTDAAEIQHKLLDRLASEHQITVIELGQETVVHVTDVIQVVLDLVIREGSASPAQIAQILAAREQLWQRWGIMLMVIEIP